MIEKTKFDERKAYVYFVKTEGDLAFIAVNGARWQFEQCQKEIDSLKAENERLREALQLISEIRKDKIVIGREELLQAFIKARNVNKNDKGTDLGLELARILFGEG